MGKLALGIQRVPRPLSRRTWAGQGGDFDWIYISTIFFSPILEDPHFQEVARAESRGNRQNLEPQTLAAKIFRNNDLRSGKEWLTKSMVENLLGPGSRMGRACAFQISQ